MDGTREYVGMVMPLKVLTDKEVQEQGRVCVLVCACVFQTSMI